MITALEEDRRRRPPEGRSGGPRRGGAERVPGGKVIGATMTYPAGIAYAAGRLDTTSNTPAVNTGTSARMLGAAGFGVVRCSL